MISPPSTTFVVGFLVCITFITLRDRTLSDPYVLVILLPIMFVLLKKIDRLFV